MPELPEVETIRRDLETEVTGRRITAVYVHQPEVIKHPGVEDFLVGLRGRRIVKVERQAKYLLMRLDDDRTWVVHLMLEGNLLLKRRDDPIQENTMLVAELDDGKQLRIRDVLGYARTQLATPEELFTLVKLNLLGPEPLHPAFTFERFRERFANRRGKIKPLLLNQQILAGVGNIYADEALFRARIHPERKVNTLSSAELKALQVALIAVLREGIKYRGTTAPGGLYVDLWGKAGKHQEHLQVFRREGQPCPNECGGTVKKIRVGGRETFICPLCQKPEASLL